MKTRDWVRLQIMVAASLLGAMQSASAWWRGGHEIVARAAADALPDDLPAFFRQSGDVLAHYSAEPDAWKNPATPHLRDAEWPEHFIDYELLGGRSLPPLRWDYVALCAQLKRNPREVGFLPYAVVEETERLAIAFAEHRRSPDDSDVRRQCLVHGGILSHYAADLAQPLHLTVDYDGRTSPGAPSPRTGIHNRLDALVQAVRIEPREIPLHVQPMVFEDLFTSMVQEVILNRRAIETVYALETELPFVSKEDGVDPKWRPSERVREFGIDRTRRAAFLTASCWLTAWERSAEIAKHETSHTEKAKP